MVPLGRLPDEAAALGASGREVGVDYAIGERTEIGRGIGTALVAALVTEARRHVPGAAILVDPDAENPASRRVLERNGFSLIEIRAVVTEPTAAPRAIYRLAGTEPAGEGREEVR